MCTQYWIEDWAGNVMFDGVKFDTMEDAGEFLLEQVTEEDDIQEFCIEVAE